jgi:1-acyl-sn-glycerol-3-phosphate acyltransferase
MRDVIHKFAIPYLQVLYFCTQIVQTPFMWFLLKVLIRARVRLVTPLYLKERGVLIISNHQSIYDPFVLTYLVAMQGQSLLHFFRVVPTWFPTLSAVIRFPVLGHIISLLGAYDIGNTSIERAQGLLFTRHLLQKRQNVLIFPEGQRMLQGNQVTSFHPGINVLLMEPIDVILVRMKGMNSWRPWKLGVRYQSEFTCKQISKELSYEKKMELVRSFYEGG